MEVSVERCSTPLTDAIVVAIRMSFCWGCAVAMKVIVSEGSSGCGRDVCYCGEVDIAEMYFVGTGLEKLKGSYRGILFFVFFV